VALEFNKVVEQVQRMGRFLGNRNQTLSSRLELALQWYYAADDIEVVRRRIDLVRKSSVSGYRGGAALDEPVNEAVSFRRERPLMPDSATLIAVDGSQIYPDQHAPALYYLINMGTFTCFYGDGRIPMQETQPFLNYDDASLYDSDRRLVTNLTVNARRSVMEMQTLAKQAWTLRGDARPLVTLYDGGLLKFFGANEVADAHQIERDYMDAIGMLYDARAVLAGYLGRSRSTYIISLLHLLNLNPEDVNDFNLKTNGPLEGLTDVHLLSKVLKPGERSGLLAQNSPQNREYKDRDPNYEIAFFYVNVSDTLTPSIARVEVPYWVARNPQALDDLHALVLAQCSIQGRRRFPYALTRADELAYVSSIEKGQLDEMINIELLKNRVESEASDKLLTKDLARGAHKQHHRLGGR
jgi:hypothetical protein